MRIDRGLRSAQAAAYPGGYRAPIPTSLNTERGRVIVAPGSVAPEDFNGPQFPESVALRLRLRPQRITDSIRIHINTTAQQLYGARDEKFSHTCVQLLYQGLGKVQWDNGGADCVFKGFNIGPLSLALVSEDGGEDGIVFEKTFLHQMADLLLRPEAMPNIYPLWSYGGFFEPGCNITAIEQGVFTLGVDARPAPSPLSFWQNKTTSRSGASLRFINHFRPQHWRNLAGDIESGQVRIDLCYGADESGEPDRQIYRSHRFNQHDLNSGILEVFFAKE
jgi:hypothetical protein